MIAILSNINLDSVRKKVNKQISCVPSIGYGNVIENMMNPASELNQSEVEAVFIIMDLREFFTDCAEAGIDDRLQEFRNGLYQSMKSQIHYFISDGEYYAPLEMDYHMSSKSDLCRIKWNAMLQELLERESNVSVYPYHQLVRKIGEDNFYSTKTWYLGSIRYTMEGTKSVVNEIVNAVNCMKTPAKKVLVLDLDNTLWGGVVGEEGTTGIELGEGHLGKAYLDFQQCIAEMNRGGVILTINSKNNEEDVWKAFAENPNMYLKKEDFLVCMINWELKSENMKKIAEKLNVSLNAMVFIDDNPIEREQVKSVLPMVECPEFPGRPEDLLHFGIDIYDRYFKKIVITSEDRAKNSQYAAREQIEEYKSKTMDFNDFLKGLQIVIKRRDAMASKERLLQLLQKTNQFNTTLKRYSESEIADMLQRKEWQFYLYEVYDRFANHGLCALVVVKIDENSARIDNMVMSCRVMGRNIEYGVLDDVEENLKKMGIKTLYADYIKGPKNMPIQKLFDEVDYKNISNNMEHTEYLLKLSSRQKSISKYVGSIISEVVD